MEEKFGANEYRTTLGELMELKQTASVEEYISTFEDLQYQLTMLNTGLGEMFFVTTFVNGLSADIRTIVQSLVPKTVERAMLLARIQTQGLEKTKAKTYKGQQMTKPQNATYQ